MKDYRRYSYWLETAGEDLTARDPLDGSQEVDVAILGAGYTGLWTAYYLLRREPGLRIAVLEREIAGSADLAATVHGAARTRISRRGSSRSAMGPMSRVGCSWP